MVYSLKTIILPKAHFISRKSSGTPSQIHPLRFQSTSEIPKPDAFAKLGLRESNLVNLDPTQASTGAELYRAAEFLLNIKHSIWNEVDNSKQAIREKAQSFLNKLKAREMLALWVIKDSVGEPVGLCVVEKFQRLPDARMAFLPYIYFSENIRGAKLASYYLAVSETLAKEQGYTGIALQVRNDNTHAMQIYLGKQYKLTGERDPDYPELLNMIKSFE